MALKRKISKADFEKLSDTHKEFYKARGESYVIDIDDSDDEDAVEKLRRAKDHAAEEARQAKLEMEKIRREKEEAADALARKNGDVDTLEKSWKQKLADAEKRANETASQYRSQISRTMLNSTSSSLAAEVFGKNAKLGLPHITNRLTVEFGEDGNANLRVLDADGKPSAASLDDFKKELLQTEDFRAIIKASEASGGGSARKANQPNVGSSGERVPLNNLAPRDIVAMLDAKKEMNHGSQ